jgi:hypothetical protein
MSSPSTQPEARRRMTARPHAPAIPAFARNLATGDSGSWVKEYSLPPLEPSRNAGRSSTPDGLAATIVLPVGFTPLHVASDRVIGVLSDTLDVPYVHGYTCQPSACEVWPPGLLSG